ncbi:MAG TPA: hypothetical protein DHV36_02020 [Desulfobacteraceae bacterium]|nr:hypothetical protein [Desulfobacteraceae bacterium]|tara:strand:+ start:616 stop:1488 length:873 start_codon:yes stop_codon:yes gene_type:complete
MIRNWYDSPGAGESAKRLFSLLNLSLMVVTLVVVASEFRFDWVEKLAGRYLISTNESRPETGSIWETGRHAVNAHHSLDQIIIKNETARQTVREADSFQSLARGLGAGEWANLDKDRFRQLYLSLPRIRRNALIEPARLVWLLNGTLTDRIFCEGRMGGIKIYFIDSGNRVIHSIDLDDTDAAKSPETSQTAATLDTLPGFSGRIYPAGLFFDAVFKLPQDMVPDLISDAQALLSRTGTIQRVGIWNASENGFITLGFEFVHLGEHEVVQIRAREWAVWQLGLILKGEDQ